MKAGAASKTAELVCAGRALAHDRVLRGRFDDPTAIVLLPEEAQRRVQRQRQGEVPSNVRDRLRHAYLETQSAMMAVRTVAIDDAIRAAATPQLVILGAGLDGRAWRMPELSRVSVFEVDHPSSQHDKRERAVRLTPASSDIRFVPVDFERDELESALTAAGHDETRASTWVWEGVVMYLTRADIESTLAVVQRRSSRGSRLIVAYHSPAWVLKVIGLLLRRIGEPLRSSFTPDAMRGLLESYGFRVTADEALPRAGGELPADVARLSSRAAHLRIVVADRI